MIRRLIGAAIVLTTFAGCTLLNDVRRQLVDSEAEVRLNGYEWWSIGGFTLGRSEGFHGGSLVSDGAEPVSLAPFDIDGAAVRIEAPADRVAEVQHALDVRDAGQMTASQALRRGLTIYLGMRRELNGVDDPLPIIRLIFVPDGIQYVVDRIQLQRRPDRLELIVLIPLPDPTIDTNRSAAAQVATLAHELSHFRKVSRPGLFPDSVTDETIAHLLAFLVRWQVARDVLPSHAFDVRGWIDFDRDASEEPLDVTARRLDDLHPTFVGQALAQAIIWKAVGIRDVPFDDQVARNLLWATCERYSLRPNDVLGVDAHR